ncbi:MAG: NnrS family protein [Chloroflexota bacterium]
METPGWKPRLRWGTPLPGLLPPGTTARGEQQPFVLVAPFLRLALAISLTAGFGLGAVLALALARGIAFGPWWVTLVQVHGRAQLVGFVGLFILAIGLHFLPRLRGAPLASARTARCGLLALSAGIVVQAVTQSLLLLPWPPFNGPLRVELVLGGLLAWAGSTLIVVTLVWTLQKGPPLAWRGGLTAILPFLGFGFAALWLALLANAALDVQAALANAAALPAPADSALSDGLLFGFALPMTAAVSARLLPIYFGVELVAPAPLLALFAVLSGGGVLRLAGDVGRQETSFALGNALLGLFCFAFPLLSGVPFGARRTIRRSDPPAMVLAFRFPNALIRSAYAWLLVAGLLLLSDGLGRLAGSPLRWSADALRHTITAGYLTLLILGMGARLLPGFARQRPRARTRLIVVAIAGNLAALCRVLPPLAASVGIFGSLADAAFGFSGMCALVAVGLFTQIMWPLLSGQR